MNHTHSITTIDELIKKYPAEQLRLFDFFISPEFMNLHSQNFKIHSVSMASNSTQNLEGLGHFMEVSKGHFKSPGRGSYGGLQLLKDLDTAEYYNFAKFTLDYLEQVGAKKIEIVLPPHHYSSFRSEWLNSWFRLGFALHQVELNYAIEVDNNDFSTKVVHAVRKRIKKCLRENFVAKELPISRFSEIYKVIHDNRVAKGYPMTMSSEQLLSTAQKFPTKIQFHGVVNNEDSIIAAAVLYKINNLTDYVFYWGDLPGYADYSPITLLAEHLYSACKKNNTSLLDLGISTLDSLPNLGLIKFKENLSAKSSNKFYLIKNL